MKVESKVDCVSGAWRPGETGILTNEYYDPNEMASGVAGKGVVAVAVPGTGRGAHRACIFYRC